MAVDSAGRSQSTTMIFGITRQVSFSSDSFKMPSQRLPTRTNPPMIEDTSITGPEDDRPYINNKSSSTQSTLSFSSVTSSSSLSSATPVPTAADWLTNKIISEANRLLHRGRTRVRRRRQRQSTAKRRQASFEKRYRTKTKRPNSMPKGSFLARTSYPNRSFLNEKLAPSITSSENFTPTALPFRHRHEY